MADAKQTNRSVKILKLLLITLLVIFPFGQLTRIPLPLGDAHLYLHDLIIVGIWAVLFPGFLKNRRTIPYLREIAIFTGVCIVSLLFASFRISFEQLLISSLYLVRFVSYISLVIAVREVVSADSRFSLKLKKYLIISGVTVGIFGILQYLLYPDLRNLYYLGWDPHYLRVFGTFFDPGFIGLLLTFTLFGLYLLPWKHTWYQWGSIGLVFITFVLTYSRASYLALLAGIVFLAIKKRKIKHLLIFLLLFVGILSLLPRSKYSEGSLLERTSSTVSRLQSYTASTNLIIQAPIIGWGFDTLRYIQPQSSQYFQGKQITSNAGAGIENSYLFLLLTTGIVGLLSYFFLFRHVYTSADVLLQTTLITLGVHGIFNNSFFYPWVMIWIWLLVGTGKTTVYR